VKFLLMQLERLSMNNNLTKQNILDRTSNGRDIYQFYCQALGSKFIIGRNIKNPFYNDTKPSFSFYEKGGSILFKDFGEPKYSGNVFDFVGFYYNLNLNTKGNFYELLKRINSDLHLRLFEYKQEDKIIEYKYIDKIVPEYFDQFDIKGDVLKNNNVVEVRWFKTKNGKKVFSTLENPVFAYKIDESTFKIYQPLNPQFKFYWIGNKPQDYVFGLNDIAEKSPYLIIAAGEKDVLTLRSLGFQAICFNSETEMNLSENQIDELNEKFKSILVLYDNDETGIKSSQQLAEKYGFISISLPESNTRFGKDVSDYIRFAKSHPANNEITKSNLIEYLNKIIKTNKSNDLQTLDNDIFDDLPIIISQIVEPYKDIKPQRDIVFVGSLVVLGSIISEKVFGIYDGKEVFPNLYLFVMGSPASGKGAINDLRLILTDISNYLKDKKSDETDTQNDNNKKIPRSIIIPANTSFSGILKLLAINKGNGLILESEADVLNSMFKSDYGDYSSTLRQAFHHESVIVYRKTDNEHFSLENPKLSVSLTGTPKQLQNFIKNTEDGLFSRFIYITLITENEFKNVFERKESLNKYFEEISKKLLNIYKYIEDSEQIEFSFTAEQEKLFVEVFKKITEEFEKEEGDSIIQNIRRMGLIAFRIAMIFTFFEAEETKSLGLKLFSSDRTFTKTMKIVNYLLKQVRIIIKYLKLEETNILPILLKSFYELLPLEFQTKEAIQIGSKIGLEKRRIERFLTDTNYFQKLQRGNYRKLKTSDNSKEK